MVPELSKPLPLTPDISLIIPAWNEAAFLPRLLDSVDVARQHYKGGAEQIEVIVADNGSTDATAAIAAGRGCVVAPVVKRCIAASRNGGAAVARGELLGFCDADFRIHPESFNTIAGVMASGKYLGGGTGIDMERWSPGIVVTYALLMPALRVLGMDGGIWFCRRADFEQLGGYNESVRAGEDVRFLMALKALGRRRQPRQRLATRSAAKRLGLPQALVINSARKFDKHGEWHMVLDMARGLFWLPFSRRRIDAYIWRYWYEGRNAK